MRCKYLTFNATILIQVIPVRFERPTHSLTDMQYKPLFNFLNKLLIKEKESS
jgi:hypothetical protein